MASAAAVAPTVVMLAFDGLAPSLIESEVPPALQRIQSEGAFSHHVIPEFPSSDSVSTFTLSTGCRPATHGIVNDEFIDAKRGFYNGELDSSWLTDCEHLHSAAQRQGLQVATWDWFDANGEAPHASSEDRVAAIIQTLQLPPSERPRLMIAHFDGPQDVVRTADLRTDAARQAILRVDAIVGEVMQAIAALPPSDPVTLLVTTNHGLLPVWTEVNLTRILRDHGLDIEFAAAGMTAFLYIRNPEDRQPAIVALSSHPRQFQIYLKEAMPPELNIGTSDRVGDFILVANPPYIIESERRWWSGTAWLAPWLPTLPFARPFLRAAAGYPPSVRGMPGVLYAWGAGVPQKREIPRLKLIDLHPTICRMLGINPGNPVDGAVVADLVPATSPRAK